jgi:hypothetical protein
LTWPPTNNRKGWSGPDLLDVNLDDPAGDMLSAPAKQLAREPLANLVRNCRQRVDEADQAPDVVRRLRGFDEAAPAIKLDRLSDRETIAQRHGLVDEGPQTPADLFDDGQHFRRGEMPERICRTGAHHLRHALDHAHRDCERAVTRRERIRTGRSRELSDFLPRALLDRRARSLAVRLCVLRHRLCRLVLRQDVALDQPCGGRRDGEAARDQRRPEVCDARLFSPTAHRPASLQWRTSGRGPS